MTICLNERRFNWRVLDTGDLKKYSYLLPVWIKSGDVCIIPVTDAESFEAIRQMELEPLREKRVVLLGMRMGTAQTAGVGVRSFAVQQGWEYRQLEDGDPFVHVAHIFYSMLRGL